MKKLICLALALILCCSSLSACGSKSDTYPSEAIELVIPASAGGGSDLMGRLLVQIIQDNNWCPQIITPVNKAGGGGSAGQAYVNSKSDPNHTIFTINDAHTIASTVSGTRPEGGFTPICMVAKDEVLIVTAADSPYQTMEEAIAAIKANPKGLTVGCADQLDKICVYDINNSYDVSFNNVYFDSAAEIATAIMGGHVEFGMFNPSECASLVEGGKLKALASFSTERCAAPLDDVPTFTELGHDDLVFAMSRGIMGPAGMSEEAAQEFLPQYQASGGKLGYVSIQGDPFDESCETILRLARYNRDAGPNIMIKIPATASGIRAIEQCVRENIPVNCTEVFAMQQVVDILDAYDRAVEGNPNPPVVYISHIAGIFDQYLAKYAQANQVDISSDILWHAGKAVAQKIRQYMDNRGTAVKLINGGARGLQHFTEWVGCDVANTINWIGTADKLLEQDGPVVCRFQNPVPAYVLDELCNKLPDFEKAYFTRRLSAAEYQDFGPVELFCSSFRRDWKAALDIIAEVRATK